MPQPTQAGSSKVKVETPGKYLNPSIYFFLKYLNDSKWFQNLRSGSRARRKPMKKRSIHGSMGAF
jgi:hypothetical protein